MQSSSLGNVTDALRRARIQLTLRHPFLASATLLLPFKAAETRSWCQTMATDGHHIFFNPDWVATLNLDECIGVIAHEVLHVVFGHAERRGRRDPKTWNIAADYAVNLLLNDQGFSLPSGGLLRQSFRGLTTEAIYELLVDQERQSAINKGQLSQADGSGCDLGSATAPMPGTSGACDLLDPDDLRTADLRDENAPDGEQRRLIRRQIISEIKNNLRGTSSGFFAEEIEAATDKRIDWRVVLRRFLFDRVRTDWRSYPYSKRWIHRGLLLPSVGVESPGQIIIAIDTSGSISADMLAQTFAEVMSLREIFPCDVTVIQCDATLQQIDRYTAEDAVPTPSIYEVKGRGGTDFVPVFDWLEKSGDSTVSPLIYFTDGYGVFPKRAPACPTIWMVDRAGAADDQFPFGTVCRLT